jgi:hypothetical protein
MKNRSRPEGSRRHRSRKSGGSGRSYDEEIIGSRNETMFEENLLQRVDDSQIRKCMLDLNEIIDQHCENHYHLQILNINPRDLEQRLVGCGDNIFDVSGLTVAEFANMLQSPSSRMAAIRQLIAMVLFSRVDWRSRSDVSLLPPQIAAFCQTIAPVEGQPGSEHSKSPMFLCFLLLPADIIFYKVFEKAFLKWRHLSAFLIEPFRSNRESPKLSKEEISGAIERNVILLNSVLGPFIKPGRENLQHQEENLSAIAFEIAQLGLLIFSQPSEWSFSWSVDMAQTSSDGGTSAPRKGLGRTLVVFPGIGESVFRHGERSRRLVAYSILVIV